MALVIRGSTAEHFARGTGKGAHAEGSDALASGTAAHAEGTSTTASGSNSHAEGSATTASGSNTHAEGSSTTVSGQSGHAEGYSNSVTGAYSHAEGANATASRAGQHAKGSAYASTMSTNGFVWAQINSYVHMIKTTDGTATVITSDQAATLVTGSTTNVATIPAKDVQFVRVEVVARRTDTQGEMAAWVITGCVGRDSTGAARLIGTPTSTKYNDAGAAAWTATIDANTVDNYVQVTVTGAASKTINWVAGVYTTELQTVA